MLKLKKEFLTEFILYVIAIFLVIDINCVWLREYTLGDNFFKNFCCFFIVLYLIITKCKIDISDVFMSLFVFITVVISTLVNSIGYSYLLTVGVGFPLAIILSKNLIASRQDIINKIANVIYALSLLSLVFYFFGTVLNLLPGKSYVDFYWGGNKHVVSYYNIYFESQGSVKIFNNIVFTRNCGIFCEAPMFGFLVSLSFINELLLKKKSNHFKTLVLFVTGLTTTSSTCIVSMTIAIILYIISNLVIKKEGNNWIRVPLLLCAPFVFVVGIYVCLFLYERKKVFGAASYTIRMDDIYACIKVFLSSPFFGCGVGNYNPINNLINMKYRVSLGLSTGIFVILAQTGISFIIWPLIKIFKNKYSGKQYCFFAVLFVLLLFTNVPYNLINVVVIYSVIYANISSKTFGWFNNSKVRSM